MQIFTVSEFNNLMNEIFQGMEEFAVEGEVMSMTYSKGNAIFIELKDAKESAVLNVSNYAPWVDGLKQIGEGMKVIVHGKPSIYSPYGKFSFKVTKISPVGEGALKEALEKLKIALEKEGLFAPEVKHPLPKIITKIALITGKDSAAYSDFTKIIRESGQNIEIEFYPVLVQGEKSINEVASALIANSKRSDLDAIILVRGGGSLEDLASFNSEKIARAIFTSQVPVVVGVGHEVDTSIADLVADVRASTPSQAAYYLIAQNSEFIQKIEQLIDYMERQAKFILPSDQTVNETLNLINIRLRHIIPTTGDVDSYIRNMNFGLSKIKNIILQNFNSVENYNNLLQAYNPRNVLNRGYALVQKNNKYISSVESINIDDELKLTLKDGSLTTKVNKIISK